ncbi:hypothetical protein NQT62_13995 [Limnobacter humi]|uniref:Flagellar transcriptional regulator FlhC n=1 Tax=Limnobacter humi TaxID=1778671 RepID=A0ABT1WL66_9BURK|nr:hypothetical protein [Limnobacter humi]MCQ8897549.1 hypothetical protein [Limnobacter humi]
MQEFASVANHFFCQKVTDQWIIDRLFSHDLRQVEVRQAVHTFLNGRDNKEIQQYINKFKNPNRKGSGGTYCQNPMRNNRDLALIYTVLCKQIVKLEACYRQQIQPESPLAQHQRLMLMATLRVWDSFKNQDLVTKKKIRLIDLVAVMSYYLHNDWQLAQCNYCNSIGSRMDGIQTPCTVCAVRQEKKASLRLAQARESVRI